MVNTYKNVVNEFNNKKCKLLDTEDEFNEIKNNSPNSSFKLNYIASCGHKHVVFYNVFKSRNTGVICPLCKNREIGKVKKVKMENGEISKIYTVEQEFKFIKEFQKLTENTFNIIKAFDGCNIDIIYKPNNIEEDKWVGIQVKTTNKINLTYSFHMHNIYKNCLILLYCIEDKNMWLIPENIIGNQVKLSIGINKSKYNIYNVSEVNLINKLNELYTYTTKFEFEILNKPTNVYQQRELLFKNYRQKIINFIDFKYDEMEATVYDFKINNYRIQEKVSKLHDKENRYLFFLCKNNGQINGKRNQIQYDIGDNDFYWLNCDNKKYFFVIPEKILIDKGYIGNNPENKNRQHIKVTVKDNLYHKSQWLTPYMFNYETINEEVNKNRLCNLLSYIN